MSVAQRAELERELIIIDLSGHCTIDRPLGFLQALAMQFAVVLEVVHCYLLRFTQCMLQNTLETVKLHATLYFSLRHQGSKKMRKGISCLLLHSFHLLRLHFSGLLFNA